MSPPPANWKTSSTRRSNSEFLPNLPGSDLVTCFDIDGGLSTCHLYTNSHDESLLFPSFSETEVLPPFIPDRGLDVRLPFNEFTPLDPSSLANDRCTPASAFHLSSDGSFHLDPNGFETLSSNPFPYSSSSGAVGNQSSPPSGLDMHSAPLLCPASSGGVSNQDCYYSGSETHFTIYAQEYNGVTDIPQGFFNHIEFPTHLMNTPDCTTHNDNLFPVTNGLIPFVRPTVVHSPSPTPKSNSSPCDDFRVRERDLNTLAARRYRQKRTDETQTLAAELKKTQAEMDDLKVQVTRMQGELEALRQTVRSKEVH